MICATNRNFRFLLLWKKDQHRERERETLICFAYSCSVQSQCTTFSHHHHLQFYFIRSDFASFPLYKCVFPSSGSLRSDAGNSISHFINKQVYAAALRTKAHTYTHTHTHRETHRLCFTVFPLISCTARCLRDKGSCFLWDPQTRKITSLEAAAGKEEEQEKKFSFVVCTKCANMFFFSFARAACAAFYREIWTSTHRASSRVSWW